VNHLRAVVGEGSGGLDVKVTGQAASLVAVGFAYQAAEGFVYELARHGLTVNG
jgi:hypothetical protein